MQCEYLIGENIRPKNKNEVEKLIGSKVKYICIRDIDNSGRGYFFPRVCVIKRAVNREIETDCGEFIPLKSIVEMVLLK